MQPRSVSTEAHRNAFKFGRVAERAQHRPVDSIAVHRAASVVELLAKISIHSTDHIVPHRHARAFRRGQIFPSKVSRGIRLDGRSLVHLPQIFIDFFHYADFANPCLRGSGAAPWRFESCYLGGYLDGRSHLWQGHDRGPTIRKGHLHNRYDQVVSWSSPTISPQQTSSPLRTMSSRPVMFWRRRVSFPWMLPQ